jgi:hypothetical protein
VFDVSSGATPELARGTRALPIPVSEFGLKPALLPWLTSVRRRGIMSLTDTTAD